MKRLIYMAVLTTMAVALCGAYAAAAYESWFIPAQPAATTETAKELPQTFRIDGKEVSVTTYALVDANGGVTNYIKARDLAHLINGTAGNFSVDYIDGKVTFASKTKYTPNGSEGSTPFHGDREAQHRQLGVVVDGAAETLDALTLTDDNGGGYTYFKIRDLGRILGFNVTWDGMVVVDTAQGYMG